MSALRLSVGARAAEEKGLTPKVTPTGNAEVLNVTGAAAFLGTTEKALRRQVERGRVPYRRLGRKLIFLQGELAVWLKGLPGVTLAEVKAMQERRG